MPLTLAASGLAHFPKDPEAFSFDEEVSAVFPDMARRSLPLFYETHDLHAALCADWMQDPDRSPSILDVGASRGAFLAAMQRRYPAFAAGLSNVLAVDYSADMCRFLEDDYGEVAKVHQMDVTGDLFHSLQDGQWDIINCTYVVQFVRPDQQVRVLRKLSRLLAPGGVMFLGQKMTSDGPVGRMLHEQYMEFRRNNGYTQEELDAKTHALRSVMFTLPDSVLVDYLNKFGLCTVETARWTVFNNYMCTKGL